MAAPGALPVLNRKAVEQGVKTGLALHGKISPVSYFDRKHYFYADLPAGYQITQQIVPLVQGGYIEIVMPSYTKTVSVSHLRLEIDSGKSVHDAHPNKSFIDMNRAGMGLMEIVSEPELRTAEEAGAYLRQLTAILRCVGSCHGSMEEGSLRCDVNVSLRKKGSQAMGTRAEVKNVNKIKHVQKAIEFEIERQSALLQKGERVVQETRFFDSKTGGTVRMRVKEDEMDYRYMPEPDLPALHVAASDVATIAAALPELPDAMRHRYVSTYHLSLYDAGNIVAEDGAPAFFEAVIAGKRAPKKVANWVTSELFGHLHKRGLSFAESPITPSRLAALLDLLESGAVTGSVAKKVLGLMMEGDAREAAEIVSANGLELVVHESTIEAWCHTVIDKERLSGNLAAYESGKSSLMKYFVGQVIGLSHGRAHPDVVLRVLTRLLTKA